MSVTLTEASFGHKESFGLLHRLRRRKGLFLSVFAFIQGSTGILYSTMSPIYVAAGAVMVTAYPLQVTGSDISPAAEQKLGDPADMDSQIIVAKSPRLMKEMLKNPDVEKALREDCAVGLRQISTLKRLRAMIQPPPSCDQQLAGSHALDWLQDHFLVGTFGRSRIIQIAYQSQLPGVAATLVNALIDSYISLGVADKQRSRSQAEAWIRSELDRIGNELQKSELGLENFRRDHGLVRGQIASITSERLTQVSQQLASAEAAWSDAGAKLAQLRHGASDAHQTLESRTIADLKQKLAEVSGNAANMASQFGPNYPDLKALALQQKDLQQRIATETARIRSSLERDYDSASVQVDLLRKQLDELKHQVGVGDLAETQIASMVRDDDVKRELYVDLSKKANEIEAQRRLLTGDVQLVNYAEVPTKTASPKLAPFMMAGLMAGGILASTISLIRDRSDSRIRNSGRVEALAGTRVLGLIPRVKRRSGLYSTDGALQLMRPSALQESVRSLYTKCVLLKGATRPKALLLTSAHSDEGKTFLTLAMAQFGAATGKRILAVEADMRRPNFRLALGLPVGPGLVEILQAKAKYDETIQPTKLGFDVLIAGEATVASTELLSNGSIVAFLDWARERYDLVLIDSPPAQVLMDAHVIASRVDGILYCARWGYSSAETVADSILSLRQAGGQVIGLALGMVEPREYSLYEPTSLPRGPYLVAPG